MSREHRSNKEVKKKAVLTPKEKKAARKARKEEPTTGKSRAE